MQYGDEFLTKPAQDLTAASANQGTTATTRTLNVPTGIQVTSIHDMTAFDNATFAVMVSSFDVPAVAPNGTSGFGSLVGGSGSYVSAEFRNRTKTSRQIRTQSSLANTYLHDTI